MTTAIATSGPFPEAPQAELDPAVARLPKSELLLGYQRHAIELVKTSSLLVIEKSRRIGLTWGLASYAALVAATSLGAGGMKVWYMGYELTMAKEFVEVVGMWSRAYEIAASAVENETVVDDEGDYQTYRVRFASGFECTGLPCMARALRGKQGLLIVDEAAFIKDLAEVLKAAIAFLMWGGRVVVISTHDGVDNEFNQLLDAIASGAQKGVSLKITFNDALAAGLYERVRLVNKHRGMSREEWIADVRDTYGENAGEELDCIPTSGAGTWIKAEDMAACEHPDAGRPGLYQGGLVYIGRDVARRNDGQIIWAFEDVRGALWLRERWEQVGATFAAQDAAMDAMFLKYRVARAKIDQTGMGEKVVEDAQLRHGATRVSGVLFTPPNRLYLATLLRDRFEASKIYIPADPIIRTDFRTLKRAGPEGKALIVGEGMHPDRFWAAGLGCDAAELGAEQFAYQAAAARRAEENSSRSFFTRPDDVPAISSLRSRGTY